MARGRMSGEKEAERMALYNEGYSDQQMAKRLGVGDSAIWHWRTTRDLPANKRKFDDPYDRMKAELQEAQDFRKLRKEGVPIWQAVAQHYDVDPNAAYDHIKKLLWEEEDFA